MTSMTIKKSTKKEKKYMAIFTNKKDNKSKTTHFGSAGMDDYTKTKDKDQRERYRKRHKKDLNTNDPKRAGYLSYYLLWGDSTSLRENIKKYKKKYNFK